MNRMIVKEINGDVADGEPLASGARDNRVRLPDLRLRI